MAPPTNGKWSSVAPRERFPGSPDAEFEWALKRIAQLQRELTELEQCRSLYHDKDKECGVFREELRQLTAGNQLFDFRLPVGGMLIGLTASLFNPSHWISGLPELRPIQDIRHFSVHIGTQEETYVTTIDELPARGCRTLRTGRGL